MFEQFLNIVPQSPPIEEKEKQLPLDISKLCSGFKLPICYLDPKVIHTLSPIVSADLEMSYPTNTISDTSDNDHVDKCMYEHILLPKHDFAKAMIKEWNGQYTTDVDFLTDTQEVIKAIPEYNKLLTDQSKHSLNCDKIKDIWREVKHTPTFLDKYGYVDWDMLKHLNLSTEFLQLLSSMNAISPIVSLVLPIIFLILPFLILKIQGVPISVEVYVQTLKEIAKNHFIGKALMTMDNITFEKVAYIAAMFALYVIQIYQNVSSCLRFYKNTHKMNEYLCEIRAYVDHSVCSMDTFVRLHEHRPRYSDFCKTTTKHCETLKVFQSELRGISTFDTSIRKFMEVGYMLRCFYQLHNNVEYEKSLQYSFGFEGYVSNLRGLSENVLLGNLAFTRYGNEGECKIVGQYYPSHRQDLAIKNDCDLSENMIVTGPNASGKTTYLKTATINVIFSQQFGCGYYDSCLLDPYTHIHSYLNIPDTSGRDSLFQAESRRCKEILDTIQRSKSNHGEGNKKARHFCIFDELYSGTNPEEATKSAYSFLLYLSKFNNVDFILTTHYTSICKKIQKASADHIQNYKMDVLAEDNGLIKYTYKIKRGISKVQGAICILKDMDYPVEILEQITYYDNN